MDVMVERVAGMDFQLGSRSHNNNMGNIPAFILIELILSWRFIELFSVLKRKLNNAEKGREVQFIAGEPIPIAFNVWDGSQGEHGTKKAISSWFEMILK